MKLLEIIKSNTPIFLDDSVEDKKTKAAIKDINESLINLIKEYEEFLEFAKSQLEGDYHNKLVMLKSLQHHYPNWSGTSTAFSNAYREETQKINTLYTHKNTLITKLKELMNDCLKSLPVVTSYHIRNGELTESGVEHDTIILGRHNNNIIEDIISEIESTVVVEGNFNNVVAIELKANYSTVKENVELCNTRIDELFSNKPNKAEKISTIVNNMIDIAENLVFFETYKAKLLEVGCPSKDVDLYEKDLIKKYVPFKKQLQKTLKINLNDICNIVVNEDEYSDEELVSKMDNYIENDIEQAQAKYFETTSNSEETPEEEIQEEEVKTPTEPEVENSESDSPFDSMDFDLDNTDE